MTPDVLALLQGLTEQQKNYVLSAQAAVKKKLVWPTYSGSSLAYIISI